MRKLFIISGFISALTAHAQDKKEQQAIKSLCGCYEVEFMYAETFATNTNYKLSRPYNAHGLEWVEPVEITDKKLVLQHLLQLSDTTIIKHWREDWEYEKTGLWKFDKEAVWKYEPTPKRSGQWTQTVWEVDDAPRYQGTSLWVSSNNKYYWENTTDAPLPRREYTARNDYNVLQRTNRIIVTDSVWTHEQDNTKIVRADGKADKQVAQEKGFNIYTKVDDAHCAAAAAWWKQHGAFWNTVRRSWEDVLRGKTLIRLLPKVNGGSMGQQLDKLEKEQPADVSQLKARATAILQQFAETQSGTVSVLK